jgi:hypothetical protein
MPKKNRAYKSAKRSKELDRLRKQEEKRLRRLRKLETPGESPVETEAVPETDASASEETKPEPSETSGSTEPD